MKPKPGAKPDAAERSHMDRVAQLPCLVCGVRPVTLHHVSAYADRMGRIPRSHKLVTPLCPRHHQAVHDDASDPQSVERLNHRVFFERWGIDLYAEAQRLWRETCDNA